MEWIEVVGKTIEEAKNEASKNLGVAVNEIEVEVLEEPKPGLFGRIKGEARIKARIRPKSHFARARKVAQKKQSEPASRNTKHTASKAQGVRNQQRQRNAGRLGSKTNSRRRQVEQKTISWKDLDEKVVSTAKSSADNFLTGLLKSFGLDGDVKIEVAGEESLAVQVDGENLGLLVGHGGSTLLAVQEITRAIVRNDCKVPTGRVDVDIAGYREKRARALEEFALKVAEEVKLTNKAKALEPMIPADRKVVHNVLAKVEGITTTSQGDDPFRYVIISPEGSVESSKA